MLLYEPMFARLDATGKPIWDVHPDSVLDALEKIWSHGNVGWPDSVYLPGEAPVSQQPMTSERQRMWWPHLIYAYLIENTMAYEVLSRVLLEFATGEALGTPDPATQRWLRITELLWYRHLTASSILSVESNLRPDARLTRRNLYQRMFGADLNHPYGDRPVSVPAGSANTRFMPVLEDLFRDVWLAYTNRQNWSGTNQSDPQRIADLCRQLMGMMRDRRRGYNLAREEFYAVVVMDWCHYSLWNPKSPLVACLRADASTVSGTLASIASRVGIAVPRMSDEYFRMALPLSRFLQAVEQDILTVTEVDELFSESGTFTADLQQIISCWRSATGKPLTASVSGGSS